MPTMRPRTLRIILLVWAPLATVFCFLDNQFDLGMMWLGVDAGAFAMAFLNWREKRAT